MMPFLYTDEVIAPGEAILARAEQAVARERANVRDRVGFLQAGLRLLKGQREVIRLAVKSTRQPGETNKTFAEACTRFETHRDAEVKRYGPVGFTQTIPSRLQIKDPRALDGL